MYRLITIAALAIALILSYSLHELIRKKIDPRQSAYHFLLYILLHLAMVFIMVFCISFVIFKTRVLVTK